MTRSSLLASKVFTRSELAAGDSLPRARRLEFLAGRFAAKEAALKALGTGISQGTAMTDVEILRSAAGAPQLILHGEARRIALSLGVREPYVSITHDRDKAVAVVLFG